MLCFEEVFPHFVQVVIQVYWWRVLGRTSSWIWRKWTVGSSCAMSTILSFSLRWSNTFLWTFAYVMYFAQHPSTASSRSSALPSSRYHHHRTQYCCALFLPFDEFLYLMNIWNIWWKSICLTRRALGRAHSSARVNSFAFGIPLMGRISIRTWTKI